MADKGRYFAFLVYPESAPDDWVEQLRKTHADYAISPLHTPDDEDSKPHYHVIYKHSNTCTLEVAQRCIPEGIPANNHVELLHQPRNYQRYLIHLDDPEKQQFSPKEITVLNGFPLDLSRDFSHAELIQFRERCLVIIRENSIIEYSDLINYLMDSDSDLLDYAANHTIFFNTYISSLRNSG